MLLNLPRLEDRQKNSEMNEKITTCNQTMKEMKLRNNFMDYLIIYMNIFISLFTVVKSWGKYVIFAKTIEAIFKIGLKVVASTPKKQKSALLGFFLLHITSYNG